MDRRTFLKTAALGSISFAAGCTSDPQDVIHSFVEAPMEMVTGESLWYASTCRECPAGCGLLARNRDGRVVKLEGNPLHPISRGTLCMRGQAALQAVYNPDRLSSPLIKRDGSWAKISYEQAAQTLLEKAVLASEQGRDQVRMLTEITGETILGLFRNTLKLLGSGEPLIYEPFAYESLKTANRMVFGIDGLPSYSMEKADFLLTFGADFVETWLSPVSYARQFKSMHAVREAQKGRFFHVGPYQSLTGANADTWASCNPGTEAAVALGLIREALDKGRGKKAPEGIRGPLSKIASKYDTETVNRISGLKPGYFDALKDALLNSKRPLILGTSSAPPGPHALETNIACNLLNVILDPQVSLINFQKRHRMEAASRRSDIAGFFRRLKEEPPLLLILNNVNPIFSLPNSEEVEAILKQDSLFVVSISNFVDETSSLADLVIPVALPLESWDEYGGLTGLISIIQPAMKSLYGAPQLGDLFLAIARRGEEANDYRTYLLSSLMQQGAIKDEHEWLKTLQKGGMVGEEEPAGSPEQRSGSSAEARLDGSSTSLLENLQYQKKGEFFLIAAPSIRFFDGRLANRPWLCEIQDPMTQVAWHTPVQLSPETARSKELKQGDEIVIRAGRREVQAPVYISPSVSNDVLVLNIGQGHNVYGRYAEDVGVNPYPLLPIELEPQTGSPFFGVEMAEFRKSGQGIKSGLTGHRQKLALMSGSGFQHDRKIALSISLKEYHEGKKEDEHGLGMWEFPFTLPLPQGYDRKRDIYPAHVHEDYRWAMVLDLDRCIGCEACAAACYAENNVGIVGFENCLKQREMAWISVQRYYDPARVERTIFLPMLCQHCDNAPCEPVCPVFAPHHSKEGINNQIYQRCIGTRFCSQNCPYKVRRFNWFEWKWPAPLHLQLNPDVTVRSKGVMEKCSFCIQRIKEAHNAAKDENRKIKDGEIQPACLQTCPTRVFTFGNILDPNSRVRKLIEDKRAYQVMGYLNTKPAVIYLKMVTHGI